VCVERKMNWKMNESRVQRRDESSVLYLLYRTSVTVSLAAHGYGTLDVCMHGPMKRHVFSYMLLTYRSIVLKSQMLALKKNSTRSLTALGSLEGSCLLPRPLVTHDFVNSNLSHSEPRLQACSNIQPLVTLLAGFLDNDNRQIDLLSTSFMMETCYRRAAR
jgi:hypothetical protein